MKSLTTFLLFFFVFNTIITVTAQNCEVPDVLHEYYEEDVKFLGIIRMEETNEPALFDSAFVPQILQDTIWEGLAAIFNSDSPARDLVFDAYCIHHQLIGNKIGKQINVQIDPTVSWYDNWNSGEIATGSPYLDELFTTYGIDSVSNGLVIINVFTLHANESLNYQAITNLIEQDPNINFAEGNGVAGDGDEITYRIEGDARYYDFTVGWGDCPSGCIFSHSWQFSVDANCNVTYLGESGSPNPPPPEANCNITDLANNSFFLTDDISVVLSPNPVHDQLIVNFPELLKTNYTIYNMNGQIMKQGQSTNERFLLDFGPYPNGLYLLRLVTKQGQKVLKIIKQ